MYRNEGGVEPSRLIEQRARKKTDQKEGENRSAEDSSLRANRPTHGGGTAKGRYVQ